MKGDDYWTYRPNKGNNDKVASDFDSDDYGKDPYGFLLLDGPADALQTQFASRWVFVHPDDGTQKRIVTRENLLSDDPNLLTSTFTHEQSWHLVYCRKGQDTECQKILLNGASDTIISLPKHIGSGPIARVVRMHLVSAIELPKHHIRKREVENSDSAVYNLTLDYAFESIQRDTKINMRVDYSNLNGYWDSMTGPKSSKGEGPSAKLKHRGLDQAQDSLYWGDFRQ